MKRPFRFLPSAELKIAMFFSNIPIDAVTTWVRYSCLLALVMICFLVAGCAGTSNTVYKPDLTHFRERPEKMALKVGLYLENKDREREYKLDNGDTLLVGNGLQEGAARSLKYVFASVSIITDKNSIPPDIDRTVLIAFGSKMDFEGGPKPTSRLELVCEIYDKKRSLLWKDTAMGDVTRDSVESLGLNAGTLLKQTGVFLLSAGVSAGGGLLGTAFGPLISTLSPDNSGEKEARKALRAIDLRSVIDASLVLALENLNDKILTSGQDVILYGSNDGPRRVDFLIVALRSGDPEVRQTAADNLGKIKDSRAVEPLIEALQDENWNVRISGAKALLAVRKDSRALETLATAMKSDDDSFRLGTVKGLGEVKDEQVMELLINALQDKDWNVRAAAADNLGKTKDSHAVEPLIEALKDRDKDVRLSAALALGGIGDVRAFEPLVLGLKDRFEEVRVGCVIGLGCINDSRAIDPLILCLEDNDWRVQGAAKEVLRKMTGKTSAEISETMKNRNEKTKTAESVHP